MDKSFDTAVAMLFFVRDDTFSRVFEAVRKAKPKRLYLFQDGPRPNRPDDMKGILKCREICENIDWDCEVHRNYQEKNLGCDPAEHAAISWALENEEQIIYLEGDALASQSFFYYCDELLNKYKEDKRIFMICGRNQLGETHYDDNSYFFAQVDSIWGWATWRDRWQMCDHKHEFLNDPKMVKKVLKSAPTKYNGKKFINRCKKHREKSLDKGIVASYESPLMAAIYKYDMAAIVPSVNQTKNIGLACEAEHTPAHLKYIPKGQRSIYLIDAVEMEFPMKHPTEFVINKEFPKARLKLLGQDNVFRYIYRRISSFLLKRFAR